MRSCVLSALAILFIEQVTFAGWSSIAGKYATSGSCFSSCCHNFVCWYLNKVSLNLCLWWFFLTLISYSPLRIVSDKKLLDIDIDSSLFFYLVRKFKAKFVDPDPYLIEACAPREPSLSPWRLRYVVFCSSCRQANALLSSTTPWDKAIVHHRCHGSSSFHVVCIIGVAAGSQYITRFRKHNIVIFRCFEVFEDAFHRFLNECAVRLVKLWESCLTRMASSSVFHTRKLRKSCKVSKQAHCNE